MHEETSNLNHALLTAMDKYAERTCFRVKRGKRYQSITYERFQRYAFRLAHFFRTHDLAVGDRVAIVADNPLEWMVVYAGCLLAGGVVVPLRGWLSADNLQAMLKDSEASFAVVQGMDQKRIIEEASQKLPHLNTILSVNDIRDTYPGVVPITSILAKAIEPEAEMTIECTARNISPQSLALVYYKSSHPRGAMFDHARRLATMHSIADWFDVTENDVALTNILSWSLATLDATLHYFLSGVPHVIASGNEPGLAEQASPTVILTTPSGFEEFYNNTLAEMNELPAPRRAVFQWALRIGKEYLEAGLVASKQLREAYDRADLTFFSQIRGKVGGRLHRIYSTGAPLRQDWAELTEIIGIIPLNVYSLTEAGGFPAISRPDARRAESCGQVASGFQVRIADDGEILIRGKTVMCGYWQRPDDTRSVIDKDGWLHTGDLGRFDQDGYLYLTGHKHPLIVLSTGRNIMPNTLEDALTASPFIHQAVVFGHGRPYVCALIAPDLSTIGDHLRSSGENGTHAELSSRSEAVRALIDEVVSNVNRELDLWGQIEAYDLLDEPLSQTKGELTNSLKICRDRVEEHYADKIEGMYPQSIPLKDKEVTQVQLDPGELHELLEKQDILDAWLADAGIEFLFDLAREKQIDAPSMVHITDTVATIAQMQNEEKPLSTAFIIGDPVNIGRNLPESEIQLQRYDHIRRMRQIVTTLAKMVDGMVLGYGLDTHGYVRGIYKLLDHIPTDTDGFLLGPQFRHHAAISKKCDAVVFFVPAGGRQVRVFADGQLVGRYSNGNWSPESVTEVDDAVANLAGEKYYDLDLLRRIMRCAFQMSEENLGAIFTIGDTDSILERSDPPEISGFATINGADIAALQDRELINYAKQDGATIIDREGRFRGCMVLLRPDANTHAEIGPGKGARHSSAAKMSAEVNCLAVVVSQDGPITVYESGRRVLSL